MNKIKQSLIISALALSSVSVLAGEFSGNIAVSSDYDLRGISQSEKSMAVSGGLDFNADNGFFIGTWASEIDFGGSDLEWDGYVGYQTELTDGLTVKGTYIQYTYPGADVNLDYTELMVDVGIGEHFGLSVYHSDDLLNSDKSATYYGGSFGTSTIMDVNLTLSAGYYNMDNVVDDSYSTYSVKLDRNFGNMNASVAYVNNSADASNIFGTSITEDRIIGQVSVSF